MTEPQSKELTERKLVVLRAFVEEGSGTADHARQRLADAGVEQAYVTVANVVRALEDKSFRKQLNKSRPFQYRAARSFADVSKRLVGDLVERLFDCSRQKLLVQTLDMR